MVPTPQQKSSYYDEFIDPLIPAKRAFIIRVEHLARYFFAKKLLQKYKIHTAFDVSCGDGYGTKILSSCLSSVVGVDTNVHFLEIAKEVYTGKNILYLLHDIEKSSIKSLFNQAARPQAIICFETLEHIENGAKLLQEFSEILPQGGVVIISTPNAQFEPKKHGKSRNIFHKNIYYPQELEEELSKNGFIIVEQYGQPCTNFLLHKMKFLVNVLNVITEKNIWLLTVLAYCFAYPLKNTSNSYSQIIIAKKK